MNWDIIVPLIKPLILSALRKIMFGTGVVGLFVSELIKSGQITEADVSSTVVFVVSAFLTAVPLVWSFIRDLIKGIKAKSVAEAKAANKKSK